MVPAVAAGAPVEGKDVLYTLDADFDQGVLQDVNHDTPNNDQLQLSRSSVFFPFVNIAASSRGTMVRIDVNTGATLGEWFSAPDNRGRNPSRTTVDRLGNTWLSNRNEAGDVDYRDEGVGGEGSVTRIGVILGGTRVNADRTANPNGDYLEGPFAYSTCVDRDGDGLIATSRGLGDIRPWTAVAGDAGNAAVDTAADECIINYTRVTGVNTRTVAVDANNDVWTGGADTDHEKISGLTGQPVGGTQINFGCGGYGGLIDPAGTLWSARFGNNLLRYEPDTGAGTCLDTTHGDYGLGVDPNTGEIWHTKLTGNQVVKLAPDGTVLGTFPNGNSRPAYVPSAQGVAVDRDGNVWVAHSLDRGTNTVGHLRTDGTLVGNVTLPGGDGPTGVAVDSNGKIWVANLNSNNAMRIDPNAGPLGGGGFPVGAVDLTVDLGPGAGPYNYSDMTGSVLGETTAPVGTWTVVQDGGSDNLPWGKVTWNTEPQGSVPDGASITVEARAANTEADLASETFVPVNNGELFSLTGRYIEVRSTLTVSPSGVSPILSDLRIQTAQRDGGFSCQATALQLGSIVVSQANPPDVPCVDDHESLVDLHMPSGMVDVHVTVLEARTDQTPDDVSQPPQAGDNATSTARVESLRITGPSTTIEASVLRSTAAVTCVGTPGAVQPSFTSSSSIASLTINGEVREVGTEPLTIPLAVGTLRLNSTQTTGNSITQQALVLDTALTDLVLSEAKANADGTGKDADGNPCQI